MDWSEMPRIVGQAWDAIRNLAVRLDHDERFIGTTAAGWFMAIRPKTL